MKKLITLIAALTLSASAMAGIQDKRIANHVESVKKLNYDTCVERYPAKFCGEISEAFDGMIELVLVDGRQQGFKEAQRRAKK